jgi:hypothetical protein
MRITKYLGWRVQLGILLVIISIILYMLNFYLFQSLSTTGYYLSIDIAFLPIEVLFVVLVIESVITSREKQILLEKLNMVIGTFFSEIGTDLLVKVSHYDRNKDKIREDLILSDEWSEDDFMKAVGKINSYDYDLFICSDTGSVEFLEELKEYLRAKRNFLLVLLENPNLLEHETFTELLRAVFHLTEELERRKDLKKLPNADYHHLKGDTGRVYGLLIFEWLQYMEHLMNNYPYLFSLALRVNPFDPNAKVEIDD